MLDKKGEADLRAQDPKDAERKLKNIEFCMDEITSQIEKRLMTPADKRKILAYGPEIARAWLSNNLMIPDLLKRGMLTKTQVEKYKKEQGIKFKIRPLKNTLEAHVFVHKESAKLSSDGKLSEKDVKRLKAMPDPLGAKAELEALMVDEQGDQEMVNIQNSIDCWDGVGKEFRGEKP